LSLKIRDMIPGTGSEKELLEKLTQITLENLENENFGGAELAVHAGMSISTLNRRLHKITSKPTNQFIREIRLKKAMELMMQQTDTAAEVAWKVGFGSPAYFSKCFHNFYGFPPGEARKRMEEGTLPVSDEINTSDKTSASENATEEENEVSLKSGKLNKSYLVFVSVGLSALIIGFAIIYLSKKGEFIYQPAGQERSIAVLPFKNLSSEEDNQYFADGVTEDILNHLFRIGDLRVISRTTSERFRNSKLSTTEIARSMGVNYLLEGSVRKQGDNVRITAQLIDGKTDRHLWSANYDRELADIFLIQSEIAQTIARELKAAITPMEITLIEKVPTENMEAYNYYLIGNDYVWRTIDSQNYSIAISMYSKALELDPEFALAYVRLAICHAHIYWHHFDHDYDRAIKSKEAIDEAIRLDPELPEIHMALGYYNYMYLLDYQKALEEFSLAEARLRNHPECFFMKACVYRRAGDWKSAREKFLLAYKLDPGSAKFAHNTASFFYLLGEFKQSEDFFNKASLLSPAFIYSYYIKSLMYLKWKGNTVQARETIHEALKYREGANHPLIFEMEALFDFFDGQYSQAISFLQSRDIEIIESESHYHHKCFHIASIYRIMGESDLARDYYNSARIALEARLDEYPEDSRLYSSLGKVYAGMGMKEKAITMGKKGVEMMPVEKEAYRGVFRVEDLARIYVMTGEYQEAIKQLDYLLSVPGTLSVKLLLLDPTWEPLWHLPEFKTLAGKYNRDIKYY
jgi:TolB-like protein/AraC-like DNA-binding protein/Tfp pilus assembly protein PilF